MSSRSASREGGRGDGTTSGSRCADARPKLHLTVITGLSGAGKSEAVATFEDMGYFCIDNLPPQMLPRRRASCSLSKGSRVNRVALVFDARGGSYFEQLGQALDYLRSRHRLPAAVSGGLRRGLGGSLPGDPAASSSVRATCSTASSGSGACCRRCGLRPTW